MSGLVLLIFTVAYTIHVSEAKENLSITDFLLDYLLSLWVPANYAPSKFTRNIDDPATKEQMISIEKSKIALDNYINHLLKYAQENSYNNGNSPSKDSNSINRLPCINLEHQTYYPEYEVSYPDGGEGRGVIDTANNFPSQIYHPNVRPSNGYPIYDPISAAPYPYGCQSKRDATFDKGIVQGQLPGSPDKYSRRLLEMAKRIWYLTQEQQKKISVVNRYSGQQNNRLENLNADLPKTPSLISARHVNYVGNIMSPQENNKDANDVDARIFEEFYLPGYLNELLKNPQPSKHLIAPIYNLPMYSNNYNDLANAVVANRILDQKLGPQGNVLGTIAQFDKHKIFSAQPTKEQERIEKKSENSSNVVSPSHRSGQLNSNTSNSEKEIIGRALKTTKTPN